MQPKTTYDKIWESHIVVPETDAPAILFIDLHLIHEVTSPQAFDELRKRGLRVRRTDLTLGTADHSIPTTTRDALADGGSRSLRSGHPAHHELPRLRHTTLRARQRPAGYRPRDRSGAWRHPAGQDHRLRRQSYLDARCVRRAGFRHRHNGSRLRAREPVRAAAEGEKLRDRCLRPAERRRHREGHHSLHHLEDRNGRWNRKRHRIHGLCDSQPQHGRTHDGLQYVHRRRRACRYGRPRRHDVRISGGPADGAARRRVGQGRRAMAIASHRSRSEIRSIASPSMPPTSNR